MAGSLYSNPTAPSSSPTGTSMYSTATNPRAVGAFVGGIFKQYGLGNMLSLIQGYAANGMNADEIVMRLRETPQYKQRFAGMAALAKKGRAMSEGDYINLEASYANVLHNAGLPKGFYDKPEDFTKFIANDVSPSELAARTQAAEDLLNSKDANYVRAFQDFYGVDKGMLKAYFLDPSVGLGIIQKQAKAAGLGAEALRAGVSVGDKQSSADFFTGLVDAGISQDQARAAFQDASASAPTASLLGGIESTSVNAKDIVNSDLNLDAEATQKVKGLASRERARFSGSNAGANVLQNNVSGSY